MPTECSAKPMGFAPVEAAAVVADFDGGAITSDAGALLLGATDRAIGLVERFAACFADGRAAERIEHEVATLVGQRVFGIALGYEDLVDHDQLRHDPVLAVLLGKLEARHGRLRAARRQEHAEPARARAGRKPTATTRSPTTARRSRRCSSSCSSTRTPRPPKRDRARPRRHRRSRCTATRRAGSSTATTTATATCRSTSSAAAICWRPSSGARTSTPRPARSRRSRASSARSAPAGRGCAIVLRADSGFAREALMAWCEENRVDYVFGLARNPRLVEHIAHRRSPGPSTTPRRTGRPARRFTDFRWTTRDSWSRRRRVVAKAEWMRPRRKGPIRASSSPR